MSGYTKELGLIYSQVNFIQERNRVLQTQNINQQALRNELHRILNSLSLPHHVERTLLSESLDNVTTVKRVEEAALELQRSMRNQMDDDLKQMSVVIDQAGNLKELCNSFVRRFCDYFKQLCTYQAELAISDKTRQVKRYGVKSMDHSGVFDVMCKFVGLLAWLKAMNPDSFRSCLTAYILSMSKVYQSEIMEYMESLKQLIAVKYIDDVDYYFTPSSVAGITASGVAAGLSKNLAGSKNTLSNIGNSISKSHNKKPGSNPPKISTGRNPDSHGNISAQAEEKIEFRQVCVFRFESKLGENQPHLRAIHFILLILFLRCLNLS
jgi:hypothetical protein